VTFSYRRVRLLLLAVTLAYGAAFALLGDDAPDALIFFARKSVLIPAFAFGALFLREPVPFVRAWFPLLSGAILFDAARGAIYGLVERGYLVPRAAYPMAFESAIFGTPALSVPFQEHLRAPWLDLAMVGVHAAHFLGFLAVGLTIWHFRREVFPRFRKAILLVFAGGLIGYTLVPTVPPWMASSQLGLLPSVVRVADETYRRIPELYSTFDSNPVAAMPSLHTAFPAVFAFLSAAVFPRFVAVAAGAYLLLVSFAVIYLGDHYIIDIVAGWALALAAVAVSLNTPLFPVPRLRHALLLTATFLVGALALALLTDL